MGEHRLVEYLASIGPPEIQQAHQREDEILEAGKAVIPEKDELAASPTTPPPDFQGRAQDQQPVQPVRHGVHRESQQARRGIALGGRGHLEDPTRTIIIPEKHLEAWRLSCENMARSSATSLEELREEARFSRSPAWCKAYRWRAFKRAATRSTGTERKIC